MKNVSLWQFSGFAATALLGTLLHFLYDWTGQNVFAALISGVNESTWEHMKLLYFPLFIFALVQKRFFSSCKSFWCIKLFGTVFGLLLIPMLFYTYNGAVGKSPDWLNISFFFISAAAVFLLEAHLFKHCCRRCRLSALCLGAMLVIGALFIIFTFMPPHIPLFEDPVTGGYGI